MTLCLASDCQSRSHPVEPAISFGKSDHDGPVQDTSPLWGEILTDLSVDLTVRAVVATIRVMESDASKAYRLRLHDVERLWADRQTWAGTGSW